MSEGRPETNAVPRLQYWDIVWQQFRKNRNAVAGLWAIRALVLLAIFAPLVAFNRPYLLWTGRRFEFPLFGALLDLVGHELNDLGIEPKFAGCHAADGRGQRARGIVLQDDAGYAQLQDAG